MTGHVLRWSLNPVTFYSDEIASRLMRAEIRHHNGCPRPRACVTASGRSVGQQSGSGSYRPAQEPGSEEVGLRTSWSVNIRIRLQRFQLNGSCLHEGDMEANCSCANTETFGLFPWRFCQFRCVLRIYFERCPLAAAAMRTAFAMDGRTCRLQAITHQRSVCSSHFHSTCPSH
jgi:hypothetical protein